MTRYSFAVQPQNLLLVLGVKAALAELGRPGCTRRATRFLPLSLSEGEVLVLSQLEPGAVIVNQIARGALSSVTVVVVSPAFLASPWAQFSHQLAMHQSVEAASDGSAMLVSAILADCALPLLSRFRVPLDFRDQDRAH